MGMAGGARGVWGYVQAAWAAWPTPWNPPAANCRWTCARGGGQPHLVQRRARARRRLGGRSIWEARTLASGLDAPRDVRTPVRSPRVAGRVPPRRGPHRLFLGFGQDQPGPVRTAELYLPIRPRAWRRTITARCTFRRPWTTSSGRTTTPNTAGPARAGLGTDLALECGSHDRAGRQARDVDLRPVCTLFVWPRRLGRDQGGLCGSLHRVTGPLRPQRAAGDRASPGAQSAGPGAHLWPDGWQHHAGAMHLHQLFSTRPVPGWSDHRTPIMGLFCVGRPAIPAAASWASAARTPRRKSCADG